MHQSGATGRHPDLADLLGHLGAALDRGQDLRVEPVDLDALTAEQKAVLRWDEQPEFLKRAQLYPIPDAATDTAMQDMWTEMLNQ